MIQPYLCFFPLKFLLIKSQLIQMEYNKKCKIIKYLRFIIVVFNRMATYSHLTMFQTIVMTFLVVISIFAGIPGLVKVFKKGDCNFLATIFTMSMVSSFFYHLCQIYQFVPFLDRGQWQRMDNVFTISSIELMVLFLCGNLHSGSHFLEYSALINTIIIQQKDPWNFTYTVVPILCYMALGILMRIKNRHDFNVSYLKRNMILSMIFLTIGVFFYLDGLDDQNDYLRFSHGMWHLCISVFGWYAFQAVQVTLKVQTYTHEYISPTDQDKKQQNI